MAQPSPRPRGSPPTPENHDRKAPVHPSLLQPRVAVVLNVPPPWHPWLFALRLGSILPAVWWGLPSALQLLLRVLPGPELVVVRGPEGAADAAAWYALTETGLATIWVRLDGISCPGAGLEG